MNGFNPMQMLQMMSQMKNGGNANNPMAMMSQMMGGQNNANNPMAMMSQMMGGGNMQNNPQFARAQQMLQGKSAQEQEQVVRNMCQQMGIDFEQAKQMARSMGINI